MEIKLTPLPLELRVPWKISRNTSTHKNNFVVSLSSNGILLAESEVAPNIRYGETPERIFQEFELFRKALSSDFSNYRLLLVQRTGEWSASLLFALESSWWSWTAKIQKKTLSEVLNIPRPRPKVVTSFSIPLFDEGEDLNDYLKSCSEFEHLKIKVNALSAHLMVHTTHQKFPSKKLRIDGNEAWTDLEEYLNFEKTLTGLPIEFIEQPFPANRFDLYQALKTKTPFCIMADESLTNSESLEVLQTGFHAVNIKLMKSGGLSVAIKQLKQSQKLGFKTMLGCMIESSLGLSYAIELSGLSDWFDLDGAMLLRNDPYSHLSLNLYK
jgi:L-alanine-DL-glutamate epimerase-like enolase superfamily enzyme